MSENRQSEALKRLAYALVDDILNMSDKDILAEFRKSHGDPDRHAVEMRELFECEWRKKMNNLPTTRQLAAANAQFGPLDETVMKQAGEIERLRTRMKEIVENSAIAHDRKRCQDQQDQQENGNRDRNVIAHRS